MKIDRRDFMKTGALALAGLATISDKALATPQPMKITTYWGKLLFSDVHYDIFSGISCSPLDTSSYPKEYQELWALDKEYIKTKGMEHLMSNPKMTKEHWLDVRDAEIASRVIENTDLVSVLKDRYPEFWHLDEDRAIRMDLFNYLVKELEKLNPDNEDFSEDYVQYLACELRNKVPNKRFDERQEVYHTKKHYFLPTQVPTSCINDRGNRRWRLYRGNELPIS